MVLWIEPSFSHMARPLGRSRCCFAVQLYMQSFECLDWIHVGFKVHIFYDYLFIFIFFFHWVGLKSNCCAFVNMIFFFSGKWAGTYWKNETICHFGKTCSLYWYNVPAQVRAHIQLQVWGNYCCSGRCKNTSYTSKLIFGKYFLFFLLNLILVHSFVFCVYK